MSSALLAFAALDPRLGTECRAMRLARYERRVRIGIHDFERTGPQRLWFDVDLCVRLAHAPAARDHIAETLDYDFIRDTIADLAERQHFELQETLCDAIVARLAAQPGVQAVRVATRKPDVYPDCESVGVERVHLNPW